MYFDNPNISNPYITINDDQLFTLVVTAGGHCIGYDTVFVRAYTGAAYYVPSCFTPNGDGLNDEFGPLTVGISEFDYFRIYNRYGELVFETSNSARKWNGYYKGKPQNIGNFVWVASVKDRNGKRIIRKGN